MAYVTREEAVRQVTREYLESLDKANPPEILEQKRVLMERMRDAIDGMNAVLGKDEKWQKPSGLCSSQIADLMMSLHHVVRIRFSEDEDENDFQCIGMYVPEGRDAGIYTLNRSARQALARKYNYQITAKDMSDIEAVFAAEADTLYVNRERNLVAVGNGIFDFDAKMLLPFTHEKVFLSKSYVDYVPGAVNPVIHNADDNTDWDVESWMRELSDDKGVPELFWEIIGAVIRPNVRWNKFACFYSESGNNGKGTLCELMRQLCGGSSVSLSLTDLGTDFKLGKIVGKSAIITDENDVGIYVDKAANLKAVVTGDQLLINRKFMQPVTYHFYGFMVQCLNEMPRVRDRSDSFYRRQLFIPFTKCFTGMERPYIKNEYLKRRDVLEYVLYRVLNMDYYTLSEPDACKAALDEYKLYNDPVKQFVDDIFPQLQWDLVPFRFLYDLYCSWVKIEIPGSKPLGRQPFMLDILKEVSHMSDWICRDKNMAISTRKKMDAPEPLICQYDLKDWMDPTYTGNDPVKKARPMLKSSYKGIERV